MTDTAETTYLIDGSGYIFRAFYAIQRLSTSTGFPTNALYGFVRMLLKTLTLANSSRVAIIFDAGKKTFRNDLYQEYKANRRECPPELVEQMPYFRELSRALGLPVLELPGYEADDIIATLTKELASHDGPVIIVSGDKDLMQLVSDKVQIWDTMKEKRYGIPDVIEKFGVGPEQVTEFLALTGDTSDNVPGVSGIGPKTATQLIQKYQSVEGVIANLPQIKEDSEIRNRKKIAEAIELNVEQLRLSRKLVEVLNAVPLSDITVNASHIPSSDSSDNVHTLREAQLHALLTRRDADAAHLRELFERFEFSTLYKEFQHLLGAPSSSRHTSTDSYETVLASQFDEWCERLLQQKEFAFDVETTSLDVHAAKIVGLSFCWESDRAFYLPIGHTNVEDQITWEDFTAKLRPIFADPEVRKVGQNSKYDISILELNGIPVRGVSFDTMIAAYVINPDSRSFNLTALAHDFLQRSVIEYDEVTKGCATFADVAIDAATEYAAQDAHYAWLLKEVLAPRIAQEGLAPLFTEVEIPLIPVLAAMERRGIKVDLEALKEMSADFQAQLQVLETQIFNAAGRNFNINSPKQLGEVL
jgi:DNA polymerase-1